MAKIRVYELARDLNMTNKVLLGRLQDLDFPVKSHMSSLDEETVATIKERLLDLKPEGVEITRVKPGIIRRRKRVVKQKEVKIAPVSEPEMPSAEATVASPQWVEVDLGAEYTIDTVVLLWCTDFDFGIDYTIETKTTGSYETQDTIIGSTGGYQEHTFTPVVAQYVRIYITNSDYDWLQLFEFQVYE